MEYNGLPIVFKWQDDLAYCRYCKYKTDITPVRVYCLICKNLLKSVGHTQRIISITYSITNEWGYQDIKTFDFFVFHEYRDLNGVVDNDRVGLYDVSIQRNDNVQNEFKIVHAQIL